MRTLLGLCFLMPSMVAMDKSGDQVTDQEFEEFKNALPWEVRKLVDDFASWSREQKAKVVIHGLRVELKAGLDRNKAEIGYWIECRVPSSQRTDLVRCLKYLKNKK
jgi:hypothetical protein